MAVAVCGVGKRRGIVSPALLCDVRSPGFQAGDIVASATAFPLRRAAFRVRVIRIDFQRFRCAFLRLRADNKFQRREGHAVQQALQIERVQVNFRVFLSVPSSRQVYFAGFARLVFVPRGCAWRRIVCFPSAVQQCSARLLFRGIFPLGPPKMSKAELMTASRCSRVREKVAAVLRLRCGEKRFRVRERIIGSSDDFGSVSVLLERGEVGFADFGSVFGFRRSFAADFDSQGGFGVKRFHNPRHV